jgi:hypothetical protein
MASGADPGIQAMLHCLVYGSLALAKDVHFVLGEKAGWASGFLEQYKGEIYPHLSYRHGRKSVTFLGGSFKFGGMMWLMSKDMSYNVLHRI